MPQRLNPLSVSFVQIFIRQRTWIMMNECGWATLTIVLVCDAIVCECVFTNPCHAINMLWQQSTTNKTIKWFQKQCLYRPLSIFCLCTVALAAFAIDETIGSMRKVPFAVFFFLHFFSFLSFFQIAFVSREILRLQLVLGPRFFFSVRSRVLVRPISNSAAHEKFDKYCRRAL